MAEAAVSVFANCKAVVSLMQTYKNIQASMEILATIIVWRSCMNTGLRVGLAPVSHENRGMWLADHDEDDGHLSVNSIIFDRNQRWPPLSGLPWAVWVCGQWVESGVRSGEVKYFDQITIGFWPASFSPHPTTPLMFHFILPFFFFFFFLRLYNFLRYNIFF